MEHLLSMFERFDRLLIFDTETTGLQFATDQIIQFSAIALERVGGAVVVARKYNELLQLAPGRQVPPEIEKLTGITTEAVMTEGIPRERACREIAELMAGRTLLIAYNANFDLTFLFRLMTDYGDPGCLRGRDKLDLLTVYRDRRSFPHRLSNAIEAYGLGDVVKNSHSADEDALAAAYVMDAMAKEKDDLLRYLNIFGYLFRFGPPKPAIRSVTYVSQGYDPDRPAYQKRS